MSLSPQERLQTLIDLDQAGESLPELYGFWGHKESSDGSVGAGCLSQWYHAPFVVDGTTVANAEQWMMLAKARLFADEASEQLILAEPDPKKVKALGRRVSGFDTDRWNDAAYDAVVEGNVAKFTQNEALRQFLVDTGDVVLVESSPYDEIWGIGMRKSDERFMRPAQWAGRNLLGFALMDVRERIQM